MTPRSGNRLTPSIKSVTAQQHAVRARTALQRLLQRLCQGCIILRVFEDRHLLQMLVGSNKTQSLQELIAFDQEFALWRIAIREQRVPDRMYVEDGLRRWTFAIDHAMQACLRGWLAAP